ncbi:MAG: class I SAM-dependent DNA methyltransferase [Chloroflexota bacterium]
MTVDPRNEDQAAALARLYDLDFVEDPGDIDLYRALAARTGGPILELAVGSGRLAVPLAAAGYDVTGVDIDAAMLARARDAAEAAGPAAAGHLTLVEGDLVGLRVPAGATFRLAFIGLNSLLVLGTRAAQRETLATLAAHLAPGGIAAVDVWVPDADDLARFDGRMILEYGRVDPASGRSVTKIGSAQHDAATQTVTLTTIYEEGSPGEAPARWLRVDRLRLVGADEIRAMAEDAGLEVETVGAGYDLEPLGPGSDRAVVVARRP